LLARPEEKVIEQEIIGKEELKPIIEEKLEKKKSKLWLWIIGSLGVLLIILIIGFFYLKAKK